MTDQQFDKLIAAINGVASALKSRPAQSAGTSGAPAQAGPEVYPQPLRVISLADAENVEVHFGKNAGKRLGDLGEKSVSWYALEKPEKLKNDGTPFDPRPQDVALTEAARTIHHARLGTLAEPFSAAKAASAPTKPKPSADVDDSSVPF